VEESGLRCSRVPDLRTPRARFTDFSLTYRTVALPPWATERMLAFAVDAA